MSGLARPVQLSMVLGHDIPVGPMVRSVVYGSNADLIAEIAPLYLTGSVLDVTYGRGMWWRRYRPDQLVGHDLATDGVDFRELPYGDRAFDSVCFDPPYVPRHGPADATCPRDQDFRDRYGLQESRSHAAMRSLIAEGLAEVARVSRRWVLVKCCDYTTARNLQLGHVEVIEAAAAHGLRTHDLIVHASGTGPGGRQIRTVIRTRRSHSYLLVFRKALGRPS
jgi:hypothetical protein